MRTWHAQASRAGPAPNLYAITRSHYILFARADFGSAARHGPEYRLPIAGAMSLFRGSRCRVDHPGRHPRIHLLFEKAGTQAQHLGCTMRLSTEVLPVSRGARLHARECESHSIAKTGIETGTGCHRGSVPHATRGDSGLWASF